MNDPMRTKQSTWVPSDVQKWGWVVKSDQNGEVFNDKTSGLEAALEVLQVSSATSMTVRVEHSKDVKIDGIAYPATNAEYCAVYSPAKGVIVASDRHSPSYRKSTSSHLSKSPLPQLHHWSDLTFLSWYLLPSTNKEQQSPLRYVFVRGITNRATQRLITEAMRTDGYKNEEVLPWPNFWMFTPNDQHGKLSDPFLAVLGTENFVGIAPLLAQHQQVFGKKTINSVRIWGNGGKSPVLHGMVELQ
ncbi:hypothetical protein Slin15195_G030090 [Septoria linicola]|uniref:Uncharacterized protein n=1 Tax=Septoria linicola TaxID=215465 RepID=A0A9Q9ANK8_9PEZI|nr:hypothetical protein Slin14017_G029110 [Septoria linicola]USW49690.1 hypothetical protein Slin15195_G030090 [Septoria linicola]